MESIGPFPETLGYDALFLLAMHSPVPTSFTLLAVAGAAYRQGPKNAVVYTLDALAIYGLLHAAQRPFQLSERMTIGSAAVWGACRLVWALNPQTHGQADSLEDNSEQGRPEERVVEQDEVSTDDRVRELLGGLQDLVDAERQNLKELAGDDFFQVVTLGRQLAEGQDRTDNSNYVLNAGEADRWMSVFFENPERLGELPSPSDTVDLESILASKLQKCLLDVITEESHPGIGMCPNAAKVSTGVLLQWVADLKFALGSEQEVVMIGSKELMASRAERRSTFSTDYCLIDRPEVLAVVLSQKWANCEEIQCWQGLLDEKQWKQVEQTREELELPEIEEL